MRSPKNFIELVVAAKSHVALVDPLKGFYVGVGRLGRREGSFGAALTTLLVGGQAEMTALLLLTVLFLEVRVEAVRSALLFDEGALEQ